MSTTFGVYIGEESIELVDDELIGEYDEDDFVTVAKRSNYCTMWFTDRIAHLLPRDTKVYPLDNKADGIYTIGDIIDKLNN